MREGWNVLLERWIQAGLIEPDAAGRIRAFEAGRTGPAGLSWSVRIALAFGGLMLGASVLLFMSAHWDTLSPAAQFSILLLTVGAVHAAGAAVAERTPTLATTLHAVGTVALGAAIFLAAQIFNLEERWSSGMLLWAIGSWLGWALLRDRPQLLLAAILTPAWLASEWTILAERDWFAAARVTTCGMFLLALTYFSAWEDSESDRPGRTLGWIGGLTILPATFALWIDSAMIGRPSIVTRFGYEQLTAGWRLVGWSGAIGIPLIVAFALRRQAAWVNLLAVAWAAAALNLPRVAGEWALYLWFAIGSTALAAWGVRESRTERINVGSAIFAFTVLGFYSSQVMDKLGRSASLAGLGALFLAGGWALERTRRRLVLEAKGASS